MLNNPTCGSDKVSDFLGTRPPGHSPEPTNFKVEIHEISIDSNGPDLPEGASDPSYSQYKEHA